MFASPTFSLVPASLHQCPCVQALWDCSAFTVPQKQQLLAMLRRATAATTDDEGAELLPPPVRGGAPLASPRSKLAGGARSCMATLPPAV